jgi:DNA replication protein DnaC
MDAEKKNTYEVKGGFDSLIHAIEEMGQIKIDLNAPREKIDLAAMRRHEALLASQEIQAQRRENRRLQIEDIHKSGEVNAQWTFSKLICDTSNHNAFDNAKSFCKNLKIFETSLMYFVQGGPGTGKTALLHAIANDILDTSNRNVLILSYDEFKRCRIFTNKDSIELNAEKQQNWERYCSVDVLFIDDLCGNNEGLTIFDQKIFSELLRYRLAKKLHIVISTPVQFKFVHQAIGDSCYEAIKEYQVSANILYGNSRRAPLFVEGVPII